jgi:hypothetical protein
VPLLETPGLLARFPHVLAYFLPDGAGGGEGVGTGDSLSTSNNVIGGGEEERAAGGEGAGVGDGGGGGMGRVAPRKSLDGKPAAMILRSNSSPTNMCPGRTVSSGEAYCPSEEASSVKRGR